MYLLPAVLVILCCVSSDSTYSGDEEPPSATKLTVELPTAAVAGIIESVTAAGGRVLREPALRPASARLFSECVESAVARVGGAGGLFVERVIVRAETAVVTVRGSSVALLKAFFDTLRTSAGLGLRRGRWQRKTGDLLEGQSERTDKIVVVWDEVTLGRFRDALPTQEWSHQDVSRAFRASEASLLVQRPDIIHKIGQKVSPVEGVRRTEYVTSYDGISTHLLHGVLNNLEVGLGGAGVVTEIDLLPAGSKRVDAGKRLVNAQITYVVSHLPR